MERNEEKKGIQLRSPHDYDSEPPPAFARMRLHTKLGAEEGYIETAAVHTHRFWTDKKTEEG